MTNMDEALHLLHREDRTSTRPLDDVRAKVIEAAVTNVIPMRRRRLMPMTVAAAAVALVATGGIVTLNATDVSPPNGDRVALLSAAELLDGAANQIKTVDQPLAPGQYRLITEHGTYPRGVLTRSAEGAQQGVKGGTYLIDHTSMTWIPADYTQEWLNRRTLNGDPKWLGGNIPQAEAPFREYDTDTGDRLGLCGNFFPESQDKKVCGDLSNWDTPAFYAELPRDPAALYEWLRTAAAPKGGSPQTMFGFATEILRAGLMPADLRAAWYRVIAKIDGVEVSARQVTMDGREGVGISLADERERAELVISPDTGDFIGERRLTGPKSEYSWLKEGTVLTSATITTKVVDHIG
jgi:hypothetical protein